jgi:hypothetical protein
VLRKIRAFNGVAGVKVVITTATEMSAMVDRKNQGCAVTTATVDPGGVVRGIPKTNKDRRARAHAKACTMATADAPKAGMKTNLAVDSVLAGTVAMKIMVAAAH